MEIMSIFKETTIPGTKNALSVLIRTKLIIRQLVSHTVKNMVEIIFHISVTIAAMWQRITVVELTITVCSVMIGRDLKELSVRR